MKKRTTKFSTNKFIKKIVKLGERQLDKETEAFNMIKNILEVRGVNYELQSYFTYVPKFQTYSLKVDDKNVDCLPSGLVTGEIDSNFYLISNLISSQKNLYDNNINYNPVSVKISRSNHYFSTALSVNVKDISKIASAKKIVGNLVVEKIRHKSYNIMVGNLQNPKFLVFSHYDSIGRGAVDNASGVALSLDLILGNTKCLNDTLFVICGNEELSYDRPIYWGHGYREFEKKYYYLLERSEKIIVLDSFGFSKNYVYTDPRTTILGFPVKKIKKLKNKIYMISGDIKKLMRFYHTQDDKVKLIKRKYMSDAKEKILSILTEKKVVSL